MIVNGSFLLKAAPIRDMCINKVPAVPTSYGLTECGYDIRILQNVIFRTDIDGPSVKVGDGDWEQGYFALASSVEEFQMPTNLMGQVLNKSTWARQGLDASMTTNIEPGWNGFLTIELTYHGYADDLFIPAGSGICQVVFHEIMEPAIYKGKYQNQADEPVPAKTKVDDGPICLVDAKGVYPERLDAIIERQAKARPICSADGCHRTTDCGPFCRNRN